MIHVQLSADIEARLRDQARARGVEIDSYARTLIEEAVRTASGAAARPGPDRAIAAFVEAMSANSGAMPALPDEAFDRASFYDAAA